MFSTECFRDIHVDLRPLLNWVVFFEAAGAVANIGFSLKSNHQIKLYKFMIQYQLLANVHNAPVTVFKKIIIEMKKFLALSYFLIYNIISLGIVKKKMNVKKLEGCSILYFRPKVLFIIRLFLYLKMAIFLPWNCNKNAALTFSSQFFSEHLLPWPNSLQSMDSFHPTLIILA